MNASAEAMDMNRVSELLADLTPPATSAWWTQHRGDTPVVATAIHDGHATRAAVRRMFAISEEERLREEDPFTEFLIRDFANRIIVHRSRFEVDVNRPRGGAVYLRPEQAWGLQVWAEEPPQAVVDASLSVHDEYYEMLASFLAGIERCHGCFVVLDVHSYNHRRAGPEAEPTLSTDAPDINIGTISMERRKWAHVVDSFLAALRSFDFPGGPLDVRENIAFQGRGEQTRFIHEHFPDTGCAIAVEFKKVFMEEWTGEPRPEVLVALRRLLASTLPALIDALERGR
ncbi:N-formylglutamate amidohydrolase [Sinorhizobium meliloti]|uniref:N-formylglutamate amidohydrolase n=1 Tax=Rhizobium meliloti TaxID=382 RepID=UPI0001E4B5AF|nr:N-formylglutamate amidohydrolase [Sinorhizobium meliloti]AEG56354.1 N-formylglutamate amidohydrolase [Sinorhizobium meliloti AK83]MDE4588021.1 N-formylglutamate amidohydrolase [Sinorhizobium meliloti]SEJ57181.1 N-formylglutamate amidohydrolase [Sinorhizobium meliloti]